MTCCGRNNGNCVCAIEATCSCGKQPALQCTCDKAATENKLPSSTCACGKRADGTVPELPPPNAKGFPSFLHGFNADAGIDACTCNRGSGAQQGASEHETDFTTKK